ncbi:hypothetical protein RJ639_037078 [Escallonia herrerae]|uniref:Leucine-rich repeat-containing N-terminal plant-type domain-containing protein n=1 Tax=Escallonia herrerae TaxID=1293975 RepID=A0AA88WPS5_9ASTE|nr:hypothetical protein RJ639_037078 [Escallonia herrerae]
MEFGHVILRLLSWVMLALAMSRCHGCLELERLALLQIKVSINLPNRTSLPEWRDDNTTDCCDWPGVECQKATRSALLEFSKWPCNVKAKRGRVSSGQSLVPTLEYYRKALEEPEVENDDEFRAIPWLSAMQFVTMGGRGYNIEHT